MIIEPFQKRTWAEVDLDAIKRNYKQIKEKVGNTKVCCVVKTNAYADGIWRANGTDGMLFQINEVYALVVGRICMD